MMLDGEEGDVGWQRGAAAATLVVLDDAMMLPQRREIGCKRVVVHSGTAMDHDDRRAFSAFGIPEANAVARVGEVLCGEGRRRQNEDKAHHDFLHDVSMRESRAMMGAR